MDPQPQQPWQPPQQPSQPPAEPPSSPNVQPAANQPYPDPNAAQATQPPPQPVSQPTPVEPAQPQQMAGQQAPQFQPGQATPQPLQPPEQAAPNPALDYLDQISAPVQPPQKQNKLILYALIGLGAIIVLGVIIMIASSGGPSTLARASQLHSRIESLAEISQDYHKYLRDNGLRATNTAYSLFLNNAAADLEAPLASAGLKKKETAAIVSAEKAHAAKLEEEFEDARLNVVLDRTYSRQMSYELGLIKAMMQSIYSRTSSADLREYLDSANSNLTPIARDFDEFATEIDY